MRPITLDDRQLLEKIFVYHRKQLKYNRIWLVLYFVFIILPIGLAVAGGILLSQKFTEFRTNANLPGLDSIVASIKDFQQWQKSLPAGAGSSGDIGAGLQAGLQNEFKTIKASLGRIEQKLEK